jgi:hypothetical protein
MLDYLDYGLSVELHARLSLLVEAVGDLEKYILYAILQLDQEDV